MKKISKRILGNFLNSTNWGKEHLFRDFEINEIFVDFKIKKIEISVVEFTTTDNDFKAYEEETAPYALSKREYELSQAWENLYTLPKKISKVIFEEYDLSEYEYSEEDWDECWEENPEEVPKKAILGLCEGRHPLPVDGYIYGNTLDPTDLLVLREKATKALRDIQELTLYVTGLTVALVEVINVCHRLGINVTLMHFDRDSGEYFPQVVE